MIETKTAPTWSKSAAGALRECERSYAFTVASNPSEDALKAKSLKTRHMWAGVVAHEAIADVLKELSHGGAKPDLLKTLQAAKEKMREQFKASKSGELETGRLLEHEFDLAIPKSEWEKLWFNVEKSLEWFFRSAWLERLSLLGPENWKTVDEVVRFDVEGVQVAVKIDLGIEKDGRFILIDWKTSGLHPDDKLNLTVASLYAHEVWGAEPETIDAFVVSLKEGRSKKTVIDEDALMNAVLTIHEQSAGLAEASGRFADNPFEAPMTTHLGQCQRCRFQKLCHPTGLGG